MEKFTLTSNTFSPCTKSSKQLHKRMSVFSPPNSFLFLFLPFKEIGLSNWYRKWFDYYGIVCSSIGHFVEIHSMLVIFLTNNDSFLRFRGEKTCRQKGISSDLTDAIWEAKVWTTKCLNIQKRKWNQRGSKTSDTSECKRDTFIAGKDSKKFKNAEKKRPLRGFFSVVSTPMFASIH